MIKTIDELLDKLDSEGLVTAGIRCYLGWYREDAQKEAELTGDPYRIAELLRTRDKKMNHKYYIDGVLDALITMEVIGVQEKHVIMTDLESAEKGLVNSEKKREEKQRP